MIFKYGSDTMYCFSLLNGTKVLHVTKYSAKINPRASLYISIFHFFCPEFLRDFFMNNYLGFCKEWFE